MPLNTTRIRHGVLAVAIVAGALALSMNPGLSRGMGGGAGPGAMGAHANGGAGATFGGQSSGHINAQGSLNTNGPNATDRDLGRDRAEDRANMNADMSENANAHSGGSVLHTSTNAGGSATANEHRWQHGRHHHYGWRAH